MTTSLTLARKPVIFAALALAAVIGWAYAPALRKLSHSWIADPDNSHGLLVLAFCLFLVWRVRNQLANAVVRPSIWGLTPLLAAGGIRALTGYIHSLPLDQLSLIPTLIGAVWMVFGWPVCRILLPAVLYATFAIPLHGRLGFLFSNELQSASTVLSTFALQTVGIPAQREGNVIVLSDTDLGVVEACSGLRMMMSFFAIATAVAVLLPRPLWQRLAVIAAAVPVAIACNVLRITVTGIVHETVGKKWADLVFHDLAGWLMMPLALGLLWLEVLILNRIFVPLPSRTGPSPAIVGPVRHAAVPPVVAS